MRYLGIDFGLRRVGLAISDGELASPYKILEGQRFNNLLEQVKKESIGFDKVVVGMPQGKMGKTVLRFIKVLRKSGLDVIETDETLSSKRALTQVIEQGVSKKHRKFNDDTAAAIILQDWLDSQ